MGQKANYESSIERKRYFKTEIVWYNVFTMVVIHLGAFYGIYLTVKEAQYSTIIYLYFMAAMSSFGVQCGAHRLWSHRSYKARLPLKIILMLLDTLAGMTPLYDWCRDHRVHHKFSDTDADPHNANRGFFFAHCGWLMCKKHPDIKEKGKTIDMRDLDQDSVVQFQKKYYYSLIILVWGVIPVTIPYFYLGETLLSSIFLCLFLRYAISLNLTWCVNSVAHLWGMKPYDKGIKPVECVTRHLMMGEGFHNYHHTFPWDYSASELGPLEVFNPATAFIDLFAIIGWAYDLKKPSINIIKNRRDRSGSFSQTSYSKPICELLLGSLIMISPIIVLSLIKYSFNQFIL